jgi:hypothetical protein
MPLAMCLRSIVLPALGGETISAALALADRVDQVDQALAEVLGIGLEVDQLVG